MDRQFWYQRWEANRIGFHSNKVNPALVTHLKELTLGVGSRVFLPLCGKTLDIGWLLAQGYSVIGAELSELAIQQLFSELGVQPRITVKGPIKHYEANSLDIFVGDVFDVSESLLGEIDAIYDRAALVALPEEMRVRYTTHLVEVTQTAPHLLLTFDYDQSVMAGPPFSVTEPEVHKHYSDHYTINLLSNKEVPGGLKGFCPAKELVWHLRKEM